ncbi:putative embryonic polyadenylate-binding protein 2-B-like [Scophthalmus maximus]|uniref:Putative embryonic polyadenylate-binding protein 2-B-like n=1 Tax=Scophthalmus maximus TaxID=52904 RepID=A0A2U9BBX1_SCOMX|nr:putative embryonic polyadenylate-binding protein 2-B-like [Scophthalmus maximus]
MSMADNHLEYGYLEEGESIGEHFTEDPELAAIKARVQEMEMEEETERLKEERCDAAEMHLLTSSSRPGPFYNMTPEERIDADNRSVYVGNVDYGATADELEIHFNGCGPVNRVTILCDRFSGHPKGFAYIEFTDRDSVQSAIGLHETLFRGRVLKVMPKRTNMPGISTTDRGGHRGGGDSGDTWTTTNRCLNVTHVFSSSHHRPRRWEKGRVDSTTRSSANAAHSPKCFQALLSLSIT